MFLVSATLDLMSRWAGPVWQHRLFLFRERRYGKGEVEWHLLQMLVDRGRIALDVGANHGVYAGALVPLAREVHAFEPFLQLAEALRRKLPPGVTVHPFALSDRDETLALTIPRRSGALLDGLATLEGAESLARAGEHDTVAVPVQTRCLDRLGLHDVGFIKIDVEGHEIEVLLGGTEVIARDRPVLLVESQTLTRREAPYNVFAFLGGLGYHGVFVAGGEVHEVKAFDRVDTAQEDHVNNFIFFPAPPSKQLLARIKASVADLRLRRGML